MEAGIRAVLIVLLTWVVAVAPVDAVDGLDVSFADGRVTVIADQVPLHTILDEWSKLGDTQFVDSEDDGDARTAIEQLAPQPMQIHLVDVPEAEALRILLRDAAGFIAAPKAEHVAGASRFGRVLVMATSRAAAGSTLAPVASGAPGLPPAQRGPRVAVPNDAAGVAQEANQGETLEALRRILPQPFDQPRTSQPPTRQPQPAAGPATAPRPGMPVSSTDETAAVFRPVRPQADDR